jgi:hypothetical protein
MIVNSRIHYEFQLFHLHYCVSFHHSWWSHPFPSRLVLFLWTYIYVHLGLKKNNQQFFSTCKSPLILPLLFINLQIHRHITHPFLLGLSKVFYQVIWMESTSPCNSVIGYSLKWRCCSLVWTKSMRQNWVLTTHL